MPAWITRYLAWVSTLALLGGLVALGLSSSFGWWVTPKNWSLVGSDKCQEQIVASAGESLNHFAGFVAAAMGVGAIVGLSIVGTTSWHQWRNQRRITAVQQAMGIQNGGGPVA